MEQPRHGYQQILGKPHRMLGDRALGQRLSSSYHSWSQRADSN